jgi:hypothetical protein
MKHMLTTTALILALALPAAAGGPVITEDAYEAEPAPEHDRKIGGIVIGLIAIAALIALSNGGDNCTVDETPEPTPDGGC